VDHRTEHGALWVRVRSIVPTEDLGGVPLGELPILLEALAADEEVRGRP
jgi:hypothetical protein